MLSISQARFDQLGALSFVERMAVIVADADPSASEEVRLPNFGPTVVAQVHKAGRYGLHSAHHAAAFVLSAWLLGLLFDEQLPAVKAALNNPDYSAHQKAKFLEVFTTNLMGELRQKLPGRTSAQ